MAVAKFRSSSCFDAVRNACVSVERGNEKQAAIRFRLLADVARLRKQDSEKFALRLEQFKDQQIFINENLKSEINELYLTQREMEEKERNLNTKKAVLEAQKQSAERQCTEAERRWLQARAERDKAVERLPFDVVEKWWRGLWGGRIMTMEEIIENIVSKVQNAQGDMNRHGIDIEYAAQKITAVKCEIDEIHGDIRNCQDIAQSLKERRNVLHEQLGCIKSKIAFSMEAATILKKFARLSDNASKNCDELLEMMEIASKKNTLKILGSSGTKTLVGSFEECWMEIEDVMQSDNIVFAMENVSIE